MNILLTNDDGFDSLFLVMLSEAAAARGHRVRVCAPHDQQSGKSQSISMGPLRVHPREMPGAELAVSVEGTPADCAAVGIKRLCGKPELVISGMNNGYNAGFATFLSGTVGAARMASFSDIPALAVSVAYNTREETARFFADWAVRLGERLPELPLPPHALVSINCPDLPPRELKEAVMCPLSESPYEDGYDETVGPDGVRALTLGHYSESEAQAPGSDLAMLADGHITLTVLTPGRVFGADAFGLPNACPKSAETT